MEFSNFLSPWKNASFLPGGICQYLPRGKCELINRVENVNFITWWKKPVFLYGGKCQLFNLVESTKDLQLIRKLCLQETDQ